MIWKLLLYILIAYAMLLVLVFTSQRKLIYAPGEFDPSQQPIEKDLSYWPALENYRGFIRESTTQPVQGTIILFHGNAGVAHDRAFYARALALRGFRVILAEHPGYGGRSGKPSEDSLVNNALETIQLTHEEFGEPLFLWGESMGNGVVASAVAKTDVPIKSLVLFMPWDSLADLAQTHYWYLPARWLVLDKYDSVANLQGFQGNIAVLRAGQDRVIPPKHSQRLYDSLTTNKRLWLFEEAGHNTIPVAPDLPWWDEVIAFITR